ncbi:Uncharacterised protein [Legionella steigerwaltii]|uniref:N-acetyltransferase domain-containing protein n=1 Tax=Legionella steigerwaltii TaxID=460 RepID=A0A378LBH5_9GAMM|nr:hypothetical protein [Legionella steigerwaltii]KTD78567.1 hypothetical protein Lstg_1302 [Legionella steigerwaltii]STY24074.1 Uncharacterised protein [Legionella steigerwaltii]
MKLVRLTSETKNLYLEQILDLEREVTYPYGESFFKIDHGEDYFAFFERLGTLYYYVLVDKDRVAGVVATVLINPPSHIGLKKIWYYCDLKIHPDYRGRRLPIKMAYQIYLRNVLTCWNGFGISMNPASGSRQNRIKKLSKWLRWIPVRDTQLSLFSLDHAAMQKACPILERHRGEIRFLSLEGIKDLILTHDQSRIPVLHAQFGELGETTGSEREPQEGHIHMFCAPSEDPLVDELKQIQLVPSSTITLLNHGKKLQDWDWILTSDL